jgi:hypothetical protein
VSRSASFALGWATALYFGQVPGRQGRMLAVISLVAAGWVILVVGFAIPIVVGAMLEAAGVVEENFDVEFLHYLGLTAGVVFVPPALAGLAVWGEFHEDRSVRTWLRLVPASYPSAAMLGASVLQMVALTPILLFQRWRQQRKYIQISLVMREGTDDDDLVEAVRQALGSIGIEDVEIAEASGPKVWPLRTVGFAVKHLLGAVVRGEPMRLATDELEILAYATNISVQGPKELTYRVRAAIERRLGFHEAYLTWNDEAQQIEDLLIELHRGATGSITTFVKRLDHIQDRMDSASIDSEEWNVLYRRRLQVELAVRTDDPARRRQTDAA